MLNKAGRASGMLRQTRASGKKDMIVEGEGMTHDKVYKAAPGRTHKEDNCRQKRREDSFFRVNSRQTGSATEHSEAAGSQAWCVREALVPCTLPCRAREGPRRLQNRMLESQ